MSILTKAFVVLVTVLSVLLVALLVPHIAKTENYQSKIDSLNTQKLSAEQSARHRANEMTGLQSRLSEGKTLHAAEVASRNGQITALQADLDDTRAMLLREQAGHADLKSAFDRLSAAKELDSALLTTLNDELNLNRNELADLWIKVIELTDRALELESQLAGASRQVRQFAEKMTSLQERNDELETLIALLPEEMRVTPGQDAAPTPPYSVVGRITEVDATTDSMLVQVDIGRSDRVTEGMQFMVHSGNDYKGRLMIEAVDAGASAGRIILLKSGAQIQAGDEVYAGP